MIWLIKQIIESIFICKQWNLEWICLKINPNFTNRVTKLNPKEPQFPTNVEIMATPRSTFQVTRNGPISETTISSPFLHFIRYFRALKLIKYIHIIPTHRPVVVLGLHAVLLHRRVGFLWSLFRSSPIVPAPKSAAKQELSRWKDGEKGREREGRLLAVFLGLSRSRRPFPFSG